MGVTHSMDEDQVTRISNSLRESAEAIQGINTKFDVVDDHWQKMQEHHNRINSRIDDTLQSFARMDDTLQRRSETVLEVITYATDELTSALEGALITLSRFNFRKETTQLPKIIIPLTIPLIVLLIELAVANAYLGILLASLPEVRVRYSRYLLSNASTVLFGLTMSLVWLGIYRFWLSRKSRQLERLAKRQSEDTAESLAMRQTATIQESQSMKAVATEALEAELKHRRQNTQRHMQAVRTGTSRTSSNWDSRASSSWTPNSSKFSSLAGESLPVDETGADEIKEKIANLHQRLHLPLRPSGSGSLRRSAYEMQEAGFEPGTASEELLASIVARRQKQKQRRASGLHSSDGNQVHSVADRSLFMTGRQDSPDPHSRERNLEAAHSTSPRRTSRHGTHDTQDHEANRERRAERAERIKERIMAREAQMHATELVIKRSRSSESRLRTHTDSDSSHFSDGDITEPTPKTSSASISTVHQTADNSAASSADAGAAAQRAPSGGIRPVMMDAGLFSGAMQVQWQRKKPPEPQAESVVGDAGSSSPRSTGAQRNAERGPSDPRHEISESTI